MVEYIYWDFKNNPVSIEQYKSFLTEYYGSDADSRYERTMWYYQKGNYHLLLALEDGVLLGQSSAYKVFINIGGKKKEFWWSVDTFVLPAARGKGVGKNLQKKLHKDFPNFSSLWYSKANGFIKRKCGAYGLLKCPFNYYSASSFLSVLLCVFVKRFLHKVVHFPVIYRNKYFILNNLFSFKNKWIVQDVQLSEHIDELSPLIDESLKEHDFYVIRDKDYLFWKYIENPTIGGYKTLFFYSKSNPEKLLGAVIFSSTYMKTTFSIPLNVFTILDSFIVPGSGLSKRQILLETIRYYHNLGVAVDGILALGDFSYFPFLRYPWDGTALLTNYVGSSNIENPYLSYSDQDMEQMIL